MKDVKSSSRFFLGICFVLLCVQIVRADSVRSDYSRSVDFTQYQSFMWTTAPCVHSALQGEIVNQVTDVLESKGFHLVTAGHADLEVRAEITGPETSIKGSEAWHPYLGPGSPGKFSDSYKLDADGYKPGTLVIDLVDTRNNQVVWWASAKKFLYENAPEGPKNIARVLEKMFGGNEWWTTMP